MSDAFDAVVHEGVTQRRREALRAALAERGLSEAELCEVEPYVDYVARQAGTPWLLLLLFVPALLAGTVALSVTPGSGVGVALTGGCLLVVGAVTARYARRCRRARRLRRELLADPEPFVDGDRPRHLVA